MAHRTDARPPSVGERIAELREIRGYSLAELGRRASVSASMLSMVERGERNASGQVVAAVATALGVGVSHLYGQPYMEQMRQDQIDRMMEPLSNALGNWDVPPAEGTPAPRSLAELHTDVMRTRTLREKAYLAELAQTLPGLLEELSHAVLLNDTPGRDRERLRWMQAEAARGAWRVTHRMGKVDLARLALARMQTAAAESGDPRQAAVERWMRAQTSMELGRPGVDIGLRLVHQALHDLDDDGQQGTRAVRGALLLKGAILASKTTERDAAEPWLEEAEGVAKDLGETRDYELVFGPVNVALHVLSAASNRNQHGKALAAAKKVVLPEDYPPGRAAAYWMDRARAEVWTAHPDEAFQSLVRAREAAPQQTRYHPTTRETASALRRARSRVPDPLREFSLWCGV